MKRKSRSAADSSLQNFEKMLNSDPDKQLPGGPPGFFHALTNHWYTGWYICSVPVYHGNKRKRTKFIIFSNSSKIKKNFGYLAEGEDPAGKLKFFLNVLLNIDKIRINTYNIFRKYAYVQTENELRIRT